jgi:hypothetical protein
MSSPLQPVASRPAIQFNPAPEEERGELGWWPYLSAGVLLGFLLAGMAGLVFWRRRRVESPLAVPEIERPLVPGRDLGPKPKPRSGQLPLPLAPTVAPPPEGDAISLALEARQLSLTLTSAALAYRVTLTNNGPQRLTGIRVAGDMVSAHASLPREQQMANAASALDMCHELAGLAPGETAQVTGEFRLPFALMRPIRKGKAVMFVPLARLKVEAANTGNNAVFLTALVGQRSREPGAGLQPFRLDHGPRIYREVTQKIFS